MPEPLETIELPEPANYYEGVDAPARPVSAQVLLFTRHDRRSLQQQQLSNRLHHRYVLMHAIETGGLVSVEGKSLRLDPGYSLLVLPYQFHHYIQLDAESLRWLFITFELQSGADGLQLLSHSPFCPKKADRILLEQLVALWQQRSQAQRTQVLPLLDQYLGRILQQAKSSLPEPTIATGAPHSDAWIAKVESLLIHSIQQGQSLEWVAEKAGLSSRYLRSRFEAATGASPSDYRSRYQLSRALALMQNTQLRLGEIAELCGFNSQAVFTRFIRRQTGISPKTYRQNQQ